MVENDLNFNPFEGDKKPSNEKKNDFIPSNSTSNPFESKKEVSEAKSLLEQISSIEKRDTNYIFLFGRPGTGKTYIIASLIYYMKVSKLGDLVVSGENSRDAITLEEDLYNNFHKGKILDRTNVAAPPYEINLTFTPKDSKLPKMKITFLEMSGENLRKVQIQKDDPHSGKLPDNIDIYFMCKKIKLIFLLISDHETASRDSLTINRFLDYILNKNSSMGNANCLLAITKWDRYEGKYKNNVEKFTEESMPNIHNRLKNESLGNAITHYSIGNIVSKEDKGKTIDEVISIDTKRAEVVVNWLYRTITKKSLMPEPRGWDKIVKLFGI